SLGEDQVVVAIGSGLIPVVAQVASNEHREDIGRRHARGGMTGAGARARPDRIDAQLSGELRQGCDIGGAESGGHGLVLGTRDGRRVDRARLFWPLWALMLRSPLLRRLGPPGERAASASE